MPGFGNELAIWCPSVDDTGALVLTEINESGLDGTLVNNAAWVDDTENGGVQALEFNGSNHVDLDVAKGIIDGATQWTVGIWYKIAGASIGSNESPFGDSLASLSCFPTHRFRNGNCEFLAGDGEAFWLFKVIGGLPPVAWQCVVVGYDGDVVRVFSQGALVAEFDVGDGKQIIGNSLRLGGGGSSSTRHFEGRIDDFRVWNTYVADQVAGQWYSGGRGYLLGGAQDGNIAHVPRSIQQQQESMVVL